MKNLFYNKLWTKPAAGIILVGLFLSACNGGVDSQTTPATPNMVSIDATATVPVFAGTSTTSVVYVHNNSDTPISDIKYSVQDNSGQNKPDTNQFMLTTTSCSVIAAHGSCSLGFTTPVLKAKSAQGSAIITAKYPHGYFKQIINYAQVQNGSSQGIYGSDATIHSYGNASGYAVVYLYAGGQNQSYKLQNFSSNNAGITINQPSNNSLTSGQIVAVEVSTNTPNILANNQVNNVKTATMQVNYTNLVTKIKGTALIGLTVAPINNGPVLTSGSVPIIDVQTSVNGQLLVVNSGNSSANISAITPPSGVNISSGSNACSTSTPLAAGASCTVYFEVTQAGGSNALTITYDGGATLSQNITWYNPVGGALLQMTTNPSSVSFNSGSSSTPITVTVTNIGGYDLTGVSIPAESNTNGGHATATTSTALACHNSSGGSTGTTLPVGGLCTYAITLADTVAESNMNMSLFIAGNYTNSSGAQIYQRATSISYTAINSAVYGTATLSLNPTSIFVTGTSTATITVTGASGSIGSQTFTFVSSDTSIATAYPSSCTITNPSSGINTCTITITGVAVGSSNITASNTNYSISFETLMVTTPTPSQAQLLLAPGSDYSCMLNIVTSQAYCWGYNLHGELGNGTTTNSGTPTAVVMGGSSAIPSDTALIGISAGTSNSGGGISCVISSIGKLYCWGDNHNGALGNGATSPQNNPYPVAVATGGSSAIPANTKISYVTANNVTTCAIDESGVAYCWGLNSYGQLGNGTTTDSPYPVRVATGGRSAIPTGTKLIAIGSGGIDTCAIDESGTAYCWGGNMTGSLGNGTTTNSSYPVLVAKGGSSAIPTGAKISLISVSKDNNPNTASGQCSAGYCGATTCAVAESIGYCWGNNAVGAFGNGTTTSSTYPVRVATGGSSAIPNNGKFSVISTADQQTCAIVDGIGYCWGNNSRGQLGNGTTNNALYPAAVAVGGSSAIPSGISLINVGTAFDDGITSGMSSCSLGSDNNFYCWGDNTYGELGIGSIGAPPYSTLAVQVLIP